MFYLKFSRYKYTKQGPSAGPGGALVAVASRKRRERKGREGKKKEKKKKRKKERKIKETNKQRNK